MAALGSGIYGRLGIERWISSDWAARSPEDCQGPSLGSARFGRVPPAGPDQTMTGTSTMASTPAPGPDEPLRSAVPRRRIPMALITWAFVGLVLLIVVALLLVKVTRGTTTVVSPPVAPAPASVVRAVQTIPASVFDAVAVPDTGATGPVALQGQPFLTMSGRPAVVYVGAEFCPYCAAERWALVAALSRFGSFSHLGATSSASNEVFPQTATFSFDGASYRSSLVAWSGVEEFGQAPSSTAPAGFPRLHVPTPLQWALLHRYDSGPNVAGSGSLPFVDVGNRYVVSGAAVGFSPGVLQGASMNQIAADLSDPTSPVTQAIVGAANVMTASICQVTGQKPGGVCTSPGVRAGARYLASS